MDGTPRTATRKGFVVERESPFSLAIDPDYSMRLERDTRGLPDKRERCCLSVAICSWDDRWRCRSIRSSLDPRDGFLDDVFKIQTGPAASCLGATRSQESDPFRSYRPSCIDTTRSRRPRDRRDASRAGSILSGDDDRASNAKLHASSRSKFCTAHMKGAFGKTRVFDVISRSSIDRGGETGRLARFG